MEQLGVGTFCSQGVPFSNFFYSSVSGHCICPQSHPVQENLEAGADYKYFARYVESWMTKVITFSSEYSVEWGAAKTLGPYNVYPRYGDIRGTWAQVIADVDQWIERGIDEFMYFREIRIYETYFSGHVSRISLRDVSVTWIQVWQADAPQNLGHSRIFLPDFQVLSVPTDGIRLDLFRILEYVEIDAIKEIGYM